jgi:CHAT domain-containing protein
MGEFKKAQDEYIRVAARASDEQFARMMVSVAEMLVASNRPQSALIRYEKALSLIKPAKDSVLEISILTGIGRCHMVLGSYDTAQEYFDLASAKARESGNRALEAGVIASIGELQYWIAITSSTAVHKVATTFYSASSDGPMEFFHQSLLSAGRLSPAAGTLGRPDVYVESSVKPRFSRALRTYNEALSLMHDVGDRIGEIGVLTNMGLVYDAWGKRREALSFYLPALQKMDEFQTLARLEDFRIDLANQSSRLYQRAIELEFRQHHMEEAFNLSERSRARSFLDQLGNGRIDLAKNAPTDFSQREARLRRENISLQRQLAQELAKSGPEVNPETISSLQSRLSAVQREYEESVRGLKISSPEYASFLSIAPLTLREVQRKLASDVTVLSYFTTPGITLAFVVTKNGFHVFRLPVSGAELSMAITSLLDFPGESDEPPPLRSLYSWLIEPVRSRLKTAKLVVVPHGVLNNLPFAALTPDGEEFLNDSYAISYLPSTSVLPYINASVKPVGNQVLVMANDQEEGTPQLSHAYDEAREVAALWHARLLMGADATASSLQTSAGDYSILHLIAHIYADPNHPQFSRIILAQNKESDGSLELNGILGLDLRKTSLVVLSGCRGQSGNWSRGDDVTALNRAFMYAGAPSVIASLWSVDDDATQQLMIAFYSHLKEGLSKAEALRAAQIEVRRIHRNPFYWAGFVLTGDPGESANSSLVARSAK